MLLEEVARWLSDAADTAGAEPSDTRTLAAAALAATRQRGLQLFGGFGQQLDALHPTTALAPPAADGQQQVRSLAYVRASPLERADPLDAPAWANGMSTAGSIGPVVDQFYAPGGEVASAPDDVRRQPPRLEQDTFDPFAPENFAQRRILRTSPLTKVEPYC